MAVNPMARAQVTIVVQPDTALSESYGPLEIAAAVAALVDAGAFTVIGDAHVDLISIDNSSQS